MGEGTPNDKEILTIPARVLPGWMSREEALNLFTKQCVPPLSGDEAMQLWTTYRSRVLELGRQDQPTERLPKDPEEQEYAEKFMDFLHRISKDRHEVAEVAKVDLRQVIATQHLVVTERSLDYAGMSTVEAAWREELLPTDPRPPQIGIRSTIGFPEHSHPLHSTIVYDLPDAEFAFLPHGNGLFGVAQLSRHVIATPQGDFLLLKNGYHRSVARLRDLAARSLRPTALIAVERVDPKKTEAFKLPYRETTVLPAAVLADYIAEDLYRDVLLRRKRYQIQVKARWMAIDDEG